MVKYLVLTAWLMAAWANGQTPATNIQPFAVPRLANLPSAPGPHIAKIQALGDDKWYNLFSPAPDPVWGKARGRAWTPKMAYAPDLGGAFLLGSGTHGFLKPDSHYQDDLFFYDINANRWVCAWPGTKRTWRLRLNSIGWEEDSTGMPVPVARCGHGYEIMSYDSDLKKFVFMATGDPYWGTALPLRMSWLPAGANMYWMDNHTRCPFYYDVATGKWERPYMATGGADMHGEWVTEYIPTLRKIFRLQGTTVMFYDHEANVWTTPATTGTAPSGYDVNMCYDGKRDRVYIGHDTHFSAFDIQTSAWITLASAYVGSGLESNMTYDSVNDIVLSNVYMPSAPQAPMMRAYDPASDSWKELHPMLKRPGACINAYYDPALNVHVYHGETDSREDGTVVVYRYGRGAVPAEKNRPCLSPVLSVGPNPFTGGVAIRAASMASIGIFDVSGGMVAAHAFSAGEGAWMWRPGTLPPGLYLVRAVIGGKTHVKKAIYQK